jgi:hypothetical protein
MRWRYADGRLAPTGAAIVAAARSKFAVAIRFDPDNP